MFCSNCGTQLPDEANFCLKCGKAQQGTATTSNDNQYEHCRIELIELGYRLFQGTVYRFDANAIGTEGPYVAGQSKEFSINTGDREQLPILNALIRHLVADSWEAVETKGAQWYQHSFRRRVLSEKVSEKVNLVILSAGSNKIETIKAIRILTNMHLAEAKTLAETPNGVILSRVSKSTALRAQSLFQKAGAMTKIV